MLSLLQDNKEHYCLQSYGGAPLRTLMGTKSSIARQSAKCCCFILKSAWGSGVYVDVLFHYVAVNSFQSNLAQNSRMRQLTQLFWMTVLSFIHALVCTNASRSQDQLVCLSVTNFSLWSCGDSPPHSTAESFKRRDTKHTNSWGNITCKSIFTLTHPNVEAQITVHADMSQNEFVFMILSYTISPKWTFMWKMLNAYFI